MQVKVRSIAQGDSLQWCGSKWAWRSKWTCRHWRSRSSGQRNLFSTDASDLQNTHHLIPFYRSLPTLFWCWTTQLHWSMKRFLLLNFPFLTEIYCSGRVQGESAWDTKTLPSMVQRRSGGWNKFYWSEKYSIAAPRFSAATVWRSRTRRTEEAWLSEKPGRLDLKHMLKLNLPKYCLAL